MTAQKWILLGCIFMVPVCLSLGTGCLVSSLGTCQDHYSNRHFSLIFFSDTFFFFFRTCPSPPLSAPSIWCIFLCLERPVIDRLSAFRTHRTLYLQVSTLTPKVVGTFLRNDHKFSIFVSSNKLPAICLSNSLERGDVMAQSLSSPICETPESPPHVPSLAAILWKATSDVR